MLYLASNLFNKEISEDLKKRLICSSDWVDGKLTASGSAALIKRNLQLRNCDVKTELTNKIIEAISNNSLINSYTFANKILNVLFTRTGVGMYYGPHVDIPYISTGRRDFSFTIFLNEPDEYDGGELLLYIPPETKKIKLNQGDIVIYPTKYLHEVKKVTKGERMVCVGWIESQVEKDDERENLYLIRSSLKNIIEKHGDSAATKNLQIAFNRLYKRFST